MIKTLSSAKEPGSAITHLIGGLITLIFSPALLIKAASSTSYLHPLSMAIFVFSMIMLYTASTLYHTFDISEEVNKKLRKFDHMAIYALIAGTYTPICLIVLKKPIGSLLLTLIWSMAFIGMIITVFWVNVPKWLAASIYIAMGWTCVIAFIPLMAALSTQAFGWLIAGGIIYTIGGVIYALKLPLFNKRFQGFGSHEIFHLFVMGGSFCHFILMYKFVSQMPLY